MGEAKSVMETDCPACGGWPSEADGSCVWCVRTLNAWGEGEIRLQKFDSLLREAYTHLTYKPDACDLANRIRTVLK